MRRSWLTRAFIVLCVASLGLFGVACDSDGGDGGGNGGDGGDGGDGGSGKAVGEGPCSDAAECAGEVCIALVDGDNPPNYCTQECGSCPDGFYCDSQTFALIGLSFCRFGDTGTTPTPPSEPPRVICETDADCPGDAVCATYQSKKDCTSLCDVEDDCTPPALGGVTMDIATCGQDEGQDRTVCLPDPNCFPNAMPCISGMPNFP